MFWIAPVMFALAIALWSFSHHAKDHTIRFFQLSAALICFMLGLATAHWMVNLIILTGLIIYPTCSPREPRVIKPDCSKFCLLRRRCKSSSVHPV